MPSTVTGGSLGRWFEQLCRIEHEKLRDVVCISSVVEGRSFGSDAVHGGRSSAVRAQGPGMCAKVAVGPESG